MRTLLTWMVAIAALAVGCGGGGSSSAPTDVHGSRGVTMGGAEDIGQFRSIVAAGGVPSPSVLDPVGFMAEHALDLPPADCGQTVCLHPTLAVAPRFDHSNWTMAFVAMNSSVDPATVARPPVHVAVVVERTTRTMAMWPAVEAGVRALVASLQPEDRVSLVVYGETVRTFVSAVAPTDAAIDVALAELAVGGPVRFDSAAALYDGLAAGASLVDGFAGAKRLIVVTSGHADAGLASPQRVLGLADAWARRGVSMSIVGGGDGYDAALPDALGGLGTGSEYFAESAADMERIFQNEGETTLVPLATDFRVVVAPAPGYSVGRIYGARGAYFDGVRAVLASPAIFLGLRMGSTDVAGGRRGGGGGVFVELIPDAALAGSIAPGAPAFSVTATWTGEDGVAVAPPAITVANPLAPGAVPTTMAEISGPAGPLTTGDTKPFMMLNMYLALNAVTSLYDDGDCARSLGVVDMIGTSVALYERYVADPDIHADWLLLQQVRTNVDSACRTTAPVTPIQPTRLRYGCMFS